MRFKSLKTEIIGQLRKATGEKLAELGDFYVSRIRDQISQPYPPASEPNTPPHQRTGDLWESISWIIDDSSRGKRLRIFSPLPYAYWLEMGTSKMEPRPFMLVTVIANLEAGRQIIGTIKVGK